ncbi:lysophospholipid acyltransferase family protein [Anaerosporobacter faecicola]|uniref:lysophospholipid acyltransferase family protein n=1 Tax=Anaerosporobacter faecicola TaxID=2718714 RepID=UPI001438DBE4|nr:lysophospholipid acyltransferase family protein [Anaerosporobacter faecicola]
MKTLFVGVFLLIFFILSIPLLFIEFIIGKFNKQLKVRSSQKIVVTAFKMILAGCGVKKTVIGLENIPKDTPVLYVSNHRSYFDILIGYTSVPTLTGFVAKKEMIKLPFISSWMKNLHCLFLDRENIKEGMKTILEGISLVKNGHSIFIAPEGTRNHEKEMLPFKEGSFKIAEKSGCPIIPVSMNNTDNLFENHLPWIRKGHVIIEFGEPIYVKDLPQDVRRHLAPYVQGIIKDTLEKNEALI